MIEQELKICQMVYELSVKDAALVVTNKEIEEKNNTIKQLTEKLQQFQSQYQDYKATCNKIIDDQRAENLELRDQLPEFCLDMLKKNEEKTRKIEELSTKLAEVVVERNAFADEVAYWKDSIDRKNDYIDELHEHIEDLESIIEGQKKQIADLENKLKDRLSSTSDKAGSYKMPDYERFRKFADEVQRKMMEVWEVLFNE
jgi:chromosome segregation ATPase